MTTLKNEKAMPDFLAMSDREVWFWDCGPLDEESLTNWTDLEFKAVLAQGKALRKRAQTLGIPYGDFIDKIKSNHIE
jgi:hypothetical protein